MANAKTKTTTTQAASEEFDWSTFLPEGMKASDFVEVKGDLTPIYTAEEASTHGFPPLIGKMDRIEALPPQGKGKNEWIPWMIRVVASAPTKAMGGTGDDREPVDVKIGDDVYLPIGGNMKIKRQLLLAALDTEKVFTVAARVSGSLDVGQPSEMWVWQTLIGKPETRTGRFAIPQQFGIEAVSRKKLDAGGVPADATGEVLDASGKPVKSIVNNQARA